MSDRDPTTEVPPVPPTVRSPTVFTRAPHPYIVALIVGLLFLSGGASLWGFARAFQQPSELEIAVPGLTETETVVSSWTEHATEYVESPARERTVPVLVPVERPAEAPPPIPGPTRTEYVTVPGPTVTKTKRVPGPTKTKTVTVTETVRETEHHHHVHEQSEQPSS